ncbi:MAG: DNA-invertase hin [Pelotomaculum sp. PtaB.Bin104]|nr:MAG: DNA-invertase hin [Pelotomaculum sp. PtaB.Bin104]HBR31210.1 resolvase [Clostridiales bacterium]
MKFGYARVSTGEQNTDRQLDALREYGVDEIYEEKISGGKRSRPQLNLLLSKLRTGDTLVVYELKRLGRNTKQLLAMAEEFQANGIEFVSLTEKLDTTTPMGRFVFTTWCALAQLDREIISENTKSGLAAAKARGRIGGRKPHDKKQIEKALKMYFSNEFSIKEITESTGVSKASIYEYVHKYEKNLERKKEHGKE